MKKQLSILIILIPIITNLSHAQPFQYKNSESLLITFQTSQEVIEQLVPQPLEANKEGIINLEIVIQKMDLGFEYVYNEMILSIPVEYNGTKSLYHKILYLDKTPPITLGREIWGFPKHFADIEIEMQEQNISATISQDENIIIELNAEFVENIDNAAAIEHQVWFVHKRIRSIEKGEMDVDQINAVFIHDFKTYNTRAITVDLKLNSIPEGNIGMIPVLGIISSVYYESDFILGFGETVVNFKE
jgi:acetoacetate decarboxylase